MAEAKKKPTLRKAPKGSLKEAGDGAASAKEAARDVRALEQHEKAAARKAVRDANEASKERKRQAKQDEKAAKAEAKAAAKKERAGRKAQEKAARAEARERDKAKRRTGKNVAPEEAASSPADAAAPAPEGAVSAPAKPDAAGSEEESFAESLERELEDASVHLDGIGGSEGAGVGAGGSEGERADEEPSDADAGRVRPSEPNVQFVSGEDAYDLPAPDQAGKKRPANRARGALPRVSVGRVLLVVAIVVAIAAIAAVGAFSWNRWLRFDDAADFQGTWAYGDTAYQVAVDGTTMTLTKDAAYDYELDTFQKTVSFRFGDLSGHGCYAFSEDRNTLVIVDGRTPDVGTILGLTDIAENAGAENDGTSTVIVLKRVSTAPAGQTGSQSAQSASDASQAEGQGSATTDGEAANAGTQAGEGDGSSSEGVDIDGLGNDPGESAGSNVVTPEDLGITLTEEGEGE